MAASSSKCYVTFYCRCPDTTPGEEVCLLGSPSSLGEWLLPLRIRLSTSPDVFPLWSSPAILLPTNIEITYKYLIAPNCTCSIRGSPRGAPAAAAACCCSGSSRNSCRWECIAGHDAAGNRLLKLGGGSHELFDKFGQCDLPPLSTGITSHSLLYCENFSSNKKQDPWHHQGDQFSPSSPRIYGTHATDLPPRRNSVSCLTATSHSNQDATIRLNMLKSIQTLCKQNATQVGDLRQTVERSHSQLLQMALGARNGGHRGELPSEVSASLLSAVSAGAGAAASEAIQLAVQSASESVAKNLLEKTAQVIESVISERMKQIATEVLTKAVTGVNTKLEETAEKLLTAINRRCGSAGTSVASLGPALHSSGSSSASTVDASQLSAEPEESEMQLLRGSHRRSRSADIELRHKRKEKVGLGVAAKSLSVSTDYASSAISNSLSSADFTDTVLTSKDIGPDLACIQLMVHGIKRETANIRQLLGLICHNLDATRTLNTPNNDEVGRDGENITTYQIFSPQVSRESSDASLDDISSDDRKGDVSDDKKIAFEPPPARIFVNNEASEGNSPTSPRVVIEKNSISMTESREMFERRCHRFPDVYTANGTQPWEDYISTNKGLRKEGH